MDNLLLVGKILKTHGLKGALKIASYIDKEDNLNSLSKNNTFYIKDSQSVEIMRCKLNFKSYDNKFYLFFIDLLDDRISDKFI